MYVGVCVCGGGGEVQGDRFPYYPLIPTLVRGYLYVVVSRDGGTLRDVISVRHAGWYRLTKTVVHPTFLQRFETILNSMCVFQGSLLCVGETEY